MLFVMRAAIISPARKNPQKPSKAQQVKQQTKQQSFLAKEGPINSFNIFQGENRSYNH